MKQNLALILALCMLLGALAGCSSTEVRSFSEDAASDETDPFAPALDAYAPDTVVMTINGTEVHWNEYAYWLCNAADSLTTYVGDVEDWSAVYDEDTGETVRMTGDLAAHGFELRFDHPRCARMLWIKLDAK